MALRTVAIIQARLGSTRLPRKVLFDICGKPMLARVVERVQMATAADEVVIATSIDQQDNQIESLCNANGWSCYRGSRDDVLDRFYRTACAFDADYVIRVSADCPLIDPGITDRVARAVIESGGAYDYAANMLPPRTFPRGVDVEAFTIQALRSSWQDARDDSCREHVTPWIYRNPDRFRICQVEHESDESSFRWTVDTDEDLAVVRLIHEHLATEDFRWTDVVDLCRRNPHWTAVNAHVQQRAA